MKSKATKWTDREKRYLRAYYPTGGARTVMQYIDKSRPMIVQAAKRAGLACDKAAALDRTYPLTPIPAEEAHHAAVCLEMRAWGRYADAQAGQLVARIAA